MNNTGYNLLPLTRTTRTMRAYSVQTGVATTTIARTRMGRLSDCMLIRQSKRFIRRNHNGLTYKENVTFTMDNSINKRCDVSASLIVEQGLLTH
jgi:hypothetical protein